MNKFRELKVWEVSTAHITVNDNAILLGAENNELPEIIHYLLEYGYLIEVCHTLIDNKYPPNPKLSPEFQKIYMDAVKEKVDFIKFDCDASINDNYPKFEW